ncbi:MAG: homoserine dehydrogenase, partial [Desulfobacterota bacterium]|nr:homoserine dehydrogenase [Thermodesulfobacteriota bacterium]
MKRKISVGLIGFGTVGTGVVKILTKNASLIRQRIGVPIELKRVADIDIQRNRGVTLPDGVLTKDTVSLLHDPDID